MLMCMQWLVGQGLNVGNVAHHVADVKPSCQKSRQVQHDTSKY